MSTITAFDIHDQKEVSMVRCRQRTSEVAPGTSNKNDYKFMHGLVKGDASNTEYYTDRHSKGRLFTLAIAVRTMDTVLGHPNNVGNHIHIA